MKVLMINHFPLEGSGSGTYTKNLAMQLAKQGHEVCVILPENTADFPRYESMRLHPVYFTNTNNIPRITTAKNLLVNWLHSMLTSSPSKRSNCLSWMKSS